MPEIRPNISFDAGIEQIVSFSEPQASNQQDTGQIVPAESHYKQQLNEVLFPPSVEQSLVESFRPEVANRQLLTSTGYHGAHETCMDELCQAIEKYGDRPEGAKLQKMADLLDAGADLYNLLNTYRHLLHQA